MKQPEKTNAMRILDRLGVQYNTRFYTDTDAVGGVDVAKALGENPEQVFKTLVTRSGGNVNYVFMLPVNRELDLKKAAKAVGEKSIAMIKSKELLPLTGYVHGGCSPIGMKKQFRTVVDETAQLFNTIMFSAGKIGCQIEASPEDLRKAAPFDYADICV